MAEAKLCVIAVFFINFHPAVVKGTACKFLEDQSQIGYLYGDNDSLEYGHNLHIVENTPIPRKKYPFVKKWHVGRISRKQFEIINMLWKKPNNRIVNIETITAPLTPLRKQNIIRTDSRKYVFSGPERSFPFARYVHTSSTPSYIEFYYLDEIETDDHHTGSATTKKNKDVGDIYPQNVNEGRSRFVIRSPVFALNINKPPTYTKSLSYDFLYDNIFRARQTSLPSLSDKSTYLQTNTYTKHVERFTAKTYNMKKIKPVAISTTRTKPTAISSFTTKSTETTPTTVFTVISLTVTKSNKKERETTVPVKRIKLSNLTKRSPENSKHLTETTLYDKIKFFEVYDSHTRSWLNADINNSDNDISNSERIKLENIYDSMSEKLHLNMKFAKKEIGKLQNELKDNFSKNFEDDISKKRNGTNLKVSEKTSNIISLVSREATWAEYPYIAVYFYERLQVHCDAAIFSTHWLLASAACLSRHRDDPPGEERTAFVTYCSDNWWEPDHINYVKQTIIHPKYNHQDFSKRHLYNIGTIQVVSSLSMNCHGYTPIPVMSHTYTAEPGGSMAVAVGFGLDRYATSYSANDLPKRPLSMYTSKIFSNICPGNIFYSKMKTNDKETESVFCLSLPPYFGEELDPIHGGILLVEGKLVGLYLQEERRRWGMQSAQYTSIWHLFPWVLNVAREPEESSFCISF